MKLTKKQIKEWSEQLEIPGYTIIEEKLVGDTIDPYDANEMRVVIRDVKISKYYSFTYDDWVGSGEKDSISDLTEVFQKEKTIIVYE